MSNLSLSSALKVSALICLQPSVASAEQLAELQQSNLIFETCKLEELESTAFYGLSAAQGNMLESITTKRNRIERTIKAFDKSLRQAFVGTGIDTADFKIGNARKADNFAVLAAKINLTDGQSVSIIFHAPDDDPLKITPDDTLIAFRFLLNRSDVTHVVAPSGGTDVSLKQVTVALSNLAERNSDKFQKKQADNLAQKEELEALQNSTEQLEQEQESLSAEIDSLESQVNEKKKLIDGKKNIKTKLASQNEQLEKQLAELKAKVVKIKPEQPTNENYVSDKIKDLVRDMSLADFQIHAKKNLGMTSQTAEDLYFDTRKILEQEHQQKKEAEHQQLINDDPVNRFIARITDKLKESLGDAVTFNAHKEYPHIEVKTSINKVKVDTGLFKEGDTTFKLHIDTDDNETIDYQSVDVTLDEALIADDKTVQEAVDKVLNLVAKYTSTAVDLSDLPEYGSKVAENKSTKEIAAETRALITKLKKEGKLPKGLKISITRDYSSINATITALDDATPLFSHAYLAHQSALKSGEISDTYDNWYRGEVYSVDVASIKQLVDAHIKAHHWDKSDSMTDYHHSAFFYSGGLSVGYGLRNSREPIELAAYEKSKSNESTDNNINTDIVGSKYDSELRGKELAKAIRSKINSAVKDVNSKLSGARITVKAEKSTHKDKIVVTVREVTGEHAYPAVSEEIAKIANAFNKKTGSSQDDSINMHFILAIDDATPKDTPPVEPEKQVAEFWYGLRARPIMIGTVPKGYIEALDNQQAAERLSLEKGNRSIRHGAIGFVSALSQSEIDEFELVDLNVPEQSYSFTTQEIAEYVTKNIIAKHSDAKPLTHGDIENYIAGFSQTMNKYSRDHDAVIDRKENVEQYKAFKAAFDNVQPEELQAELAKHATKEATEEVDSNLHKTGADFASKKEAVEYVMLTHHDVESITSHPELGDIDLIWGNEGKGSKKKGAKGLSHILEARLRKNGMPEAEALDLVVRMVDMLPSGEIADRAEEKAVVVGNGLSVVLVKDKEDKNHWILTGFESVGSGENVKGQDNNEPTQTDPTLARTSLGAEPNDSIDNSDNGGNMTAIERLKDALKTETDADVLMDLVEAALVEVEEADQMAEHEAFLDDASNRITELLEAQ